MEYKGKDYFKKTSIAMGLMHLFMLFALGYCLLIILLPNVALWIFTAIKLTLKYLSFGNDDWYLFNCGFFFTCLGGLVLVGIILSIMDYIDSRKNSNR